MPGQQTQDAWHHLLPAVSHREPPSLHWDSWFKKERGESIGLERLVCPCVRCCWGHKLQHTRCGKTADSSLKSQTLSQKVTPWQSTYHARRAFGFPSIRVNGRQASWPTYNPSIQEAEADLQDKLDRWTSQTRSSGFKWETLPQNKKSTLIEEDTQHQVLPATYMFLHTHVSTHKCTYIHAPHTQRARYRINIS